MSLIPTSPTIEFCAGPRVLLSLSIGMNIAPAFCEGQVDRARDYVLGVLEFNPDLTEAKNLFQRLNGPGPKCD